MKCSICYNTERNTVYTVREMMFGLDDTFTYFQCARCNCLQISGIPADMSKYYQSHYYSLSPKSVKRRRNPVRKWWRRTKDYYSVFSRGLLGKVFGVLYPESRFTMLSRIPLTKASRIVDVGCGTGWSLHALREIGFRNVLGIDPYITEDIRYENGLEVRKALLQELSPPWDVIMYNHSFEHIADPLEQLRAASRLLRKGGVCLIRVPVVSSYAWEHYREHWVQIDAPRHYFLYSVHSFRILAEKAGFSLQEVVYDSTEFQFVGSELYRRGIPLMPDRSRTLFSKSQRKAWRRLARGLNAQKRGDQAVFYLFKD